MNRQELLEVFVSANEFKEGDLLVGGTPDEYVRREAIGDRRTAAEGDTGGVVRRRRRQ
jgi:hypothetical protein